MAKKFTPSEINLFWIQIATFNWTSDPNWKRVCLEFSLMHSKARTRLAAFVEELYKELDHKFRKSQGIGSDDGWSDLRAEVIARGRAFYESITLKKLQKMAKELDYTESFKYAFQIMEPLEVFQKYRDLLILTKQMEEAEDSYKKQSEYHRLMYGYHLQLEIMREVLITK
jgi:hypothetical protein